MSIEGVKEVGPFDLTCPYCSAMPGDPCVDVPKPDMHQARFWFAVETTMARYNKALGSTGSSGE